MKFELHLCDVFAEQPLSGNCLPVVVHDELLGTDFMLNLTRELRQFETTFVRPTDEPDLFEVHIFDLERELDFAGHPLLGAVAVLHETSGGAKGECDWRLQVHDREVPLTTRRAPDGSLMAEMDQGPAKLLATTDAEQTRRAIDAHSLDAGDLAPGLPVEVLSTGLRYLVVPVISGLDRAQIVHPQLEELLSELGAEFAYIVDVERREGRSWLNDGSVEDVATGSAAGVVGAYMLRNGLIEPGEELALRQGGFLGRPSVLHVVAEEHRTIVSGPVTLLSSGSLRPEITKISPTVPTTVAS